MPRDTPLARRLNARVSVPRSPPLTPLPLLPSTLSGAVGGARKARARFAWRVAAVAVAAVAMLVLVLATGLQGGGGLPVGGLSQYSPSGGGYGLRRGGGGGGGGGVARGGGGGSGSGSGSSDGGDIGARRLEARGVERAVVAQQKSAQEEYVVTPGVRNAQFARCTVSPEHAVLHASLRRGPDSAEMAGRKQARQPRDFDDVFATVDRRRRYYHADRPAVQTVDALGAGLDEDLDDAIAVARRVTERDVGGAVRDGEVPVAYMRTTRQDGVVAVVNFAGWRENRAAAAEGAGARVRRVVAVTKGFGGACEVAFVRPREVVRINVLVAYSGRPHRLRAFLAMFAGLSQAAGTGPVTVVVSTSAGEEAEVVKAGRQHAELTEERFRVVTSGGDERGNFSRAVALREAARGIPGDEVVFLADADLVIGDNFLQNCRVNIIKGSQVWFPVMFSLYPYGKSLSSRDGAWRRSSYGMACMYGADLQSIGGFGGREEQAFTGWGSEDVFLYNRFRDSGTYAVFRTLEPGLRHVWHGKKCERNEHFEDCMRTVYMTVGSQNVIARLMWQKRVDMSSLTKHALPV